MITKQELIDNTIEQLRKILDLMEENDPAKEEERTLMILGFQKIFKLRTKTQILKTNEKFIELRHLLESSPIEEKKKVVSQVCTGIFHECLSGVLDVIKRRK